MANRNQDAAIDQLSPGEYKQLDRRKGRGDIAWAMSCCDHCGLVSLVMREIHYVNALGIVTPRVVCRCGAHTSLELDDWMPEARGLA